MVFVFLALYAIVSIFIFVMVARLFLDFAVALNRSWRPRGAGLVLAEFAYTITDPPIRFVRRLVPPVRVGGLALDLAWTIVVFVAIVLSFILSGLAS